jgi:glycosyltransferase involved in cell wall biosynthesis
MEKQGPLVSILVVTYNQESYIRQTLDSLLEQECSFDYEILIGEDCSTDSTRDICIEYEKQFPEKIRLFLNQSNKGFIKNYFALFEFVRGKYIAECGGDDYWCDKLKLKKQVEILEKYPETGLVYGNYKIYKQLEAKFEISDLNIKSDWFEKKCYGNKAISDYINGVVVPRVVLSTACYRADWVKLFFIDKVQLFDLDKIVCEDLPLTVCFLEKGPLYMLKDELLVYRLMDESESHSKDVNKYMRGFAWKAFIQTINIVEVMDIPLFDVNPYIRRLYYDFWLHAFKTGDSKWINEIYNYSKKHNLKIGFKQRILKIFTDSNALNKVFRKLYKTLKSQ